MLVTFSCDAYENITLFGDVAKRLLRMMGQSGKVPGAILADDVPKALSNLQAAIASTPVKQQIEEEEEDEEPPVSMAHRAFPLINMLQAAMKHHCNVMWE